MKRYVELYGSNEAPISPLEQKRTNSAAPQIDPERIRSFDPDNTTDKLNLSVPGTYWYQMITNELLELYSGHPEHLEHISFSSLFNVIQQRIVDEVLSLRKPLSATGIVLTPGIQRCAVKWSPSISRNVKGYRITWWDDTKPDVKFTHEQSSELRTHYVITELEPEATVHVEVQSYRKFNDQYSNVYSIASHESIKILLGRSSDFEIPQAVTDLTVELGIGGNVKLSWQVPLDTNLSHADVKLSTVNKDDTINIISIRSIPASEWVPGGTHEETVFNLGHNIKVRFEVTLHNIYGNVSEPRTVDTIPDAQAPPPSFYARQDVTNDGIILSWSHSNAADFDKYRVRIYEADGNKLVNTVELERSIDNSNTSPRDIWSDGTTMWILDSVSNDDTNAKVYAYDLATRSVDATKGFTLTSANADPWGLAKFGDYFYVSDLADDKFYAYDARAGSNFGAYTSSADINANAAGNDTPLGMFAGSSGDLFVVDQDDDLIYRYGSSGNKSGEISLNAVNLNPTGIWFNNSVLYVAEYDANDLELYAYDVTNNYARLSSKDITLDSLNSKSCWYLV